MLPHFYFWTNTTTNHNWCIHPTKNLPGLALPLEQRRHSQSLILKDGECEWKQDSLFSLCAFIIVKWERDRTLVSYCVRRGRANSSVLAACRSWYSAACPSHLSQCRAVPDTGRLSDRRPLWSVCQVLIWANIEEHSAIASMIAAHPYEPTRQVNSSQVREHVLANLFKLGLFHFHQLFIRSHQKSSRKSTRLMKQRMR